MKRTCNPKGREVQDKILRALERVSNLNISFSITFPVVQLQHPRMFLSFPISTTHGAFSIAEDCSGNHNILYSKCLKLILLR